MKCALSLEDRANAIRAFVRSKHIDRRLVRACCPRPWVADVTNGSRVFVKGFTDYSNANADGTRGVKIVFFLDEGRVYEVCQPDPPGKPERYRCTVRDGVIVRL